MICPECDEGILITEGTDCRQFWSDEYMVCNKCQTEYTLKTVYDEGTRLVTSQELLDEQGKNVFNDD